MLYLFNYNLIKVLIEINNINVAIKKVKTNLIFGMFAFASHLRR